MTVRWRSGRESTVRGAREGHRYAIDESGAVDPEPDIVHTPTPRFAFDRTLDGVPTQSYADFARQPLLPWRLSRRGPGLAVADVDADGQLDVIVGNRVHTAQSILELPALPGKPTGVLAQAVQLAGTRVFVGVSNYERTPDRARDSSWVLVYDLLPAQPIVEHSRLLVGEGTPGPLTLFDADLDGDLDLFSGGNFLPGRYPAPSNSAVFTNEEVGYLPNESLSRPLDAIGLIAGSAFGDLDGDGDQDAVLATEWGPVRVLLREDSGFVDRTRALGLLPYTGWWRGVELGDFDADGRLDIAATNAGWNTRYGRSASVRLHYGDVDGNGITDIVESFLDYNSGVYRPSRNLNDLVHGVPMLQVRFPTHAKFAAFDARQVSQGLKRSVDANTLASAVFLNRGDEFELRALPIEAQFSTAVGIAVLDANLDGHEDLVLAQNWFASPSITSRQDAGRGLLLLGDGTGSFEADPAAGFAVYGEARAVTTADMDRDGRSDVLFTQHGAGMQVYRNRSERVGLQVRLDGPPGNPDGVGAQIRIVYADGSRGPVRLVSSGSGYWAQGEALAILGLAADPALVEVQWPGGRVTQAPVEGATRRLTVRHR